MQIPKTLSGAHLDHKSRIECLEELEKELMFIGFLKNTLCLDIVLKWVLTYILENCRSIAVFTQRSW